MLDAATLKRLEFKLSINTTSSYFVWNDKGTFRFEKMPPSMQVSPITRMLVRDLNGDGNPDAVIGAALTTLGIIKALKSNIVVSL